MLSAFKDYLTQKALVKDKYIPFYLKWVSDCYSFLSEPDSVVLNPEQTNRFQKYLAKTHEDWQVKQASNALRLYSYYLTSLQKDASITSPEGENEWNLLETRTREALRLRHRSYSTEKTYITWLRSFRGYVNDKKPSQLINGDIQDFLSSLAVERKVSVSTQNQALNALIFVYRHVLEKEIGERELDMVLAFSFSVAFR